MESIIASSVGNYMIAEYIPYLVKRVDLANVLGPYRNCQPISDASIDLGLIDNETPNPDGKLARHLIRSNFRAFAGPQLVKCIGKVVDRFISYLVSKEFVNLHLVSNATPEGKARNESQIAQRWNEFVDERESRPLNDSKLRDKKEDQRVMTTLCLKTINEIKTARDVKRSKEKKTITVGRFADILNAEFDAEQTFD
jgi:hypothetical protein